MRRCACQIRAPPPPHFCRYAFHASASSSSPAAIRSTPVGRYLRRSHRRSAPCAADCHHSPLPHQERLAVERPAQRIQVVRPHALGNASAKTQPLAHRAVDLVGREMVDQPAVRSGAPRAAPAPRGASRRPSGRRSWQDTRRSEGAGKRVARSSATSTSTMKSKASTLSSISGSRTPRSQLAPRSRAAESDAVEARTCRAMSAGMSLTGRPPRIHRARRRRRASPH